MWISLKFKLLIINAIINEFIIYGLNQSERLVKLNKIAISQMKILNETDIKYLNSKQKEVVYLSKYLKVMFGTKSASSDFEYKLVEVSVAKIWKALILV